MAMQRIAILCSALINFILTFWYRYDGQINIFSDPILLSPYRFNMKLFVVGSLIVLSASLTSYGVTSTSSQSAKGDAQGFAELEVRARQIVTYHCGACHTPGLKTSNPRALKVYDLGDGKNWWKKMTHTRLMRSRTMLSNRASATKAELEENFLDWRFKARPPTPDELRSYSNFVEAALLPESIFH